jgi:hypothetical protein
VRLACALLLVWFGTHYAYSWAPIEHQATVFNIVRSLGSLVLLGLLVLTYHSRPVLLVAAGVAAEELQVIGCGTWWLISPWKVSPGDELCSAGLGFPLGSVGLASLGAVAWHLKNKGEQRDSAKS